MPSTAERDPMKTHARHSTMKKSSRRTARSKAAGAANDTQTSERAIWRGSISFGLVQIPVGMVAAERTDELSFHQLDKRDNSPIGYQRINKATGEKVEWENIVKGYEVSKGQFVIVESEDFEKANVRANQTIDIQDFVNVNDIPLAYFERPYHLIPDGRTAKAYVVLRDAMKKKKLVAIALVVIRTRQHLCAVIPTDKGLDLELLRFNHELKRASVHAEEKATAKEVALAEHLIDSMVSEWDPSKYKDSYRDDLLAAIREKSKTGTIEPKHVLGEHTPQTTDLLALLRESMKAGPKKAHAQKRTGKHQAA